MSKPKAVSLFSGCGSADLGLIEAGFEVVLANDIWRVACELYRDNIEGPEFIKGDISTIKSFPEADLQIGCYPCQGYSQGGVRDPSSKVNYLYREFDRALRQIRPKAFIVENVNGMAFGRNKRLLMNQLMRFRLAGYHVSWKVLDAKDYGLPQTRRRIFIVGIRSDLGVRYEFPAPTHGPDGFSAYLTQLDALSEMPEWPVGEFCTEPFHWYYLSRRRRHDWNEPSPCVVGHWRHVPLHPLSPPLVRINTDNWRLAHPGPARRLSFRESAALQGFENSYKWEMASVKEAFLAAGNAVPRQLLRAISEALPDVW